MALHDRSWIWHPDWKEEPSEESAGGFVHFRKEVTITDIPPGAVIISVTADTRYKLYINSKLVHYGPVKGDSQMWFYDELDIRPYLRSGTNLFAIRVLRLYSKTRFGTSFPRMSLGGLRIKYIGDHRINFSVKSDETWETAIDLSSSLPVQKDDMFLHIFESVDRRRDTELKWVPARQHKIFTAFGLASPWRLSPRMIPFSRLRLAEFQAIHNLESPLGRDAWESTLLGDSQIRLPAGTIHHVEVEASHHLTAFLIFRFLKPQCSGSELKVTYSEWYEDPPKTVQFRLKSNRRDTSKKLYGPQDSLIFNGNKDTAIEPVYHMEGEGVEEFAPFHFRTFRFIVLDIKVAEEADLVFLGTKITRTNYPLEIRAHFKVKDEDKSFPSQQLWDTSVLTLENCMHDCYEDCPFYEQLQYAMDTRSSILFTYYISGDDRLARQAIRQIGNSFQPALGLTASRSPCEHLQIIPHFSLFWVCMLVDHFQHYGDAEFILEFLPICDAVLESFKRRLDPELGLVRCYESEEFWDFVDWAEAWKPRGIPSAGRRTRFQTFSSSLYAYTLQLLSSVLEINGRGELAAQYKARSGELIKLIKTHCYDGEFFTDGLAGKAVPKLDYSQHNQIWAILCGAITGEDATKLLSTSLSMPNFTTTSIAMAFYTLRALSLVEGDVYDTHFYEFWKPWLEQLEQNVTTWVEDNVSQRSDCHAWGSAPIYEFLAEVVGVKPLSPGWGSIAFKPRMKLFANLDAKVPIVVKGKDLGIAHVQWSTQEGGKQTLSFDLKTISGEPIDVPVVLSYGGQRESLRSSFVKEILIV
ncbi:Six-hairpin glycosidase-like protein [Bisporella sp. PMI_857]|nr:Six-hairpin glycosidase-like protein [Bisporella sp. PMI_857]